MAAAVHHLPASELENLDQPLTADVLVCSDHAEATEATMALVDSIEGLRPLDAGSLAQAAAIEAFTAVLVTVNIRYKAHTLRSRLAGLRAHMSGRADRRCGSTTRPGARSCRSSPARW